jgi:signal transduction histidine kinase
LEAADVYERLVALTGVIVPDAARKGAEDHSLAWLAGDGEMAERIRTFDWSRTEIGPPETWSPALRMMVRFLLANRFPLLLWWGQQYVSIYNDAYRPVLGTKHPWGLGRPLRECWSEIWDVLKPLVDTPFKGGPATWNEDIELEINRHGFLEETHFTVAYSPVPDETVPGGIGGVLATVHEITEKVIGERRVMALRDLGLGAVEAKTAEDACIVAAEVLRKHAKDVPFALLYLIAPDGKEARLASAAGTEAGEDLAPNVIGLDGSHQPWPLGNAARTQGLEVVADLQGRFGDAIPQGPWPDPPKEAVVVPIRSNLAHQVAGFLVAGVSARLKLDHLYRSFFELVAAQIATTVASARAYEEERKRAEALAEIDRAKTAFFSNVSHEFRTPLTLMLGPLEELLRSPLADQSARENLATAHGNALRLLKLVNSLLDFARVEAGRARATYQPTDLSVFTAELASSFESLCKRAGLDLVIDCPPLSQPVYLDRDMWETIVLNLVSNAFKFTLQGRIALSVREHAGAAVLTVSDTGAGIPGAELPRLFERFHRIEGRVGRTHEGSGIGLALVQELAKLHGGMVEAHSTEGNGSVFTVRIPFGTAHLPRANVDVQHSQPSTATRSGAFVAEAARWISSKPSPWEQEDGPVVDGPKASADRPRVLIADDNSDMRGYLQRLLSPYYEVQAAESGDAALAAVSARPPDLVLADIMMPGLDGFGLLARIRADQAIRDLPVILLSARAGEEARVEGLAAPPPTCRRDCVSSRHLSAPPRTSSTA